MKHLNRHPGRRNCEGIRNAASAMVVPVRNGSLLLMSACSSAPSAPPGDVIDLTLKDFRIDVATALAGTGPVVLRVHNDAQVTHELVVVRTDLPAAELPIGSDGISVDEEAPSTRSMRSAICPQRLAARSPWICRQGTTSSSATWRVITSAACTESWR
jgi:hypothetical protein